MKRRATKVILFLLLGAIINIAVAWGCVHWMHSISSSDFQRSDVIVEGGIASESMYIRSSIGSVFMMAWYRVSLPDLHRASRLPDTLIPEWSRINRPTERFLS